jgi:hypothetical protein
MRGEWEKFGSSALDLYSEDVWFKYWLSYLRGFVGFLIYSRQVPE